MDNIAIKKILIVEDETPLLKILCEEFNSDGYAVLTAENGAAGLQTALTEHPDLILLDLIMPEMDGMKMLKILRKDTWGKNAPVLILTNLEGNVKKTIEALENNVFEFIIKNRWSLEALKERVREKFAQSS